ncbi:hypothetical protein [Parapedobacter sp. 2B3]|uniref:hypothetical protein n=1 Tax=Parapedobacter sp. 2B3 TaxID=3342381 RepID=UPI0035B61F43
MVVLSHRCHAQQARGEQGSGHRSEQWPFVFGEQLPAAQGRLTERPGVELFHLCGDGRIEFGKAAEGPVAQRRVDAVVGDRYAAFDIRLVLGLVRARGGKACTVMFGHLLAGIREHGFLPAGFFDQRGHVVADDIARGHTAECGQHPADASGYFGKLLGQHRPAEHKPGEDHHPKVSALPSTYFLIN